VRAKACIRSYSHLQVKDQLVHRFTSLREAGLSIDEAWKVIAVETLAEAGLVEPEPLERTRILATTESGQIPVLDAKLVKVFRIEPAQDDRIKAYVARSKANGEDRSEGSVMRQALDIGMGELERRRAQK
jgi:hypothetical protein